MYDVSSPSPTQFSVTCFFESSKRWERVRSPPPGTFLTATAKIAGRTADTDHLAVQVLDLTYLPRPASATAI